MWIIKITILLIGVALGYTQSENQIGRRRAVPVLYVTGSHYEIGYDMGRNFASIIKSFLATYNNLREFEAEYKTDPGRAIYYGTLAHMKERFPYYVKEIQGIADGAKVPFYQLFLLHLDDLILTANDNHVPRNDTGGCSSIGVNNRQNSVLGHTEDAFSETVNHFYIVHAHVIPTPEDAELGATEERFASLCYAGQMPGYTSGFNEHGLVFSINTLSPHQLKPGNTPRTFITRKVLSSKNFCDAEKILRDEGLGIGNGFSVNMFWSNASRATDMYNVEVAPDLKADRSQMNVHKYQNEMLVHCNMYERLPVENVIGDIIDSSAYRLGQIRSYPPAQTKKEVTNILSDTTGEEYRIFQDQKDKVIKTIAAGIFDLDERTWSIYINRPNASEPIAVIPIVFQALDNIH